MVGTALWHEQGPQMILLWSIVGKFFLQVYMFNSNIRHAADFSPLVFYRIRWSPNSGTSRVSRRQLARIRVAAFERRILSQGSWSHFAIWGAGRDGHLFFSELSEQARSRVVAFVDLDSGKCGTSYTNHHCVISTTIPIVHFKELSAYLCKERVALNDSGHVPAVACVAKRRKGDGCTGDLENNVGTLGLIEGVSLWYCY